MDCETALKQAITADDPIQNLVHTFGNASLEKWLEIGFGDTLGKCLAEETKTKISIIKYLVILNAIIPPVPYLMDDEFDTISFEGCLMHSDQNQVAKLITQIISPVIMNYDYLKDDPLYHKVLLKTVYYANENDINDDLKDWLFDIIMFDLCPRCSRLCHVAMELINILGKKMSDAWFQNFLKPKVFIQTRMIIVLSEEKVCPYVNALRTLYYELNLEEKFEIKVPMFKALIKINHMFREDCLVMALRRIALMNRDNPICAKLFIQSGLLHKFHTLLCKPSEIGDQAFVIQSFLTVFLDLDYVYDYNIFEELVALTNVTIGSLLNSHNARDIYREVHKDSPLSTIERLESEAILALQLMESLYVLNSSWHQWFDIVEENKIIEDDWFADFSLLDDIDPIRGIKNLPWFANFMKVCPAFNLPDLRLEMFEKVKSNKENSGTRKIYFNVNRNNVLNDIFGIFSNCSNFNYINDRWDFYINGEIARGPGVTKEVYSILSQELRKSVPDLWQGQPIKGSDNEMKYTYFKNGLVPNVNKETKNFKLLGMIMAKAILDKQFLDIPLSNDFFQRLKTTHHEIYSHLKREYFDLLQTFPMLESLYKQLLPVKRKIELIRTEVGLSQHQKQEIIGNLTFDDGSSFDDLCVNFTVPGTDIELIEGGRDIILSPFNIDSYLEKLCAFRAQLDPVNQFKAIREGFDEVLSPGSIDLLLPEELKLLFCCDEFQRWTVKDLQSNCNYTISRSVGFLFETLSSFDTKMQKLFLKFVTGMTSLPFGGLMLLPVLTSCTCQNTAASVLPVKNFYMLSTEAVIRLVLFDLLNAPKY